MRALIIPVVIAGLMILRAPTAMGQNGIEKNVRKAYKGLLKETDKDKDGKISKTEYFAIWKDKNVAAENYKTWDVDKDGFITEDEYVKVAMRPEKKKR